MVALPVVPVRGVRTQLNERLTIRHDFFFFSLAVLKCFVPILWQISITFCRTLPGGFPCIVTFSSILSPRAREGWEATWARDNGTRGFERRCADQQEVKTGCISGGDSERLM